MGPYHFKADLGNTWERDPSILQVNGRLYLLGSGTDGTQSLTITDPLNRAHWTKAPNPVFQRNNANTSLAGPSGE